MKRKLLILLILIILVFAGYKYIYQDHRDIKREHAEFILSANVVFNEFSQNSIEAEKKYLNKTIEITGTITEINKNDITINNTTFCQFSNQINSFQKINNTITIKGRCIGYDDLLELVKIDQSIIIE